jgi:hypothetical protein
VAHSDAGAQREGRVGVAQVVEVAQRVDSNCFLDRLPVAPVEVAEVEMATAGVREELGLSDAAVAGRLPRVRSPAAGPRVCSAASWLTRPVAYARRIWTTPAARSTSPCSSANNSEGLSPVAAANTTMGPNVGPSPSVIERICAQESNGRCSRQRRPGFGTPRLAGLSSISFHATPRFSTCRSACVASKRCPSEPAAATHTLAAARVQQDAPHPARQWPSRAASAVSPR